MLMFVGVPDTRGTDACEARYTGLNLQVGPRGEGFVPALANNWKPPLLSRKSSIVLLPLTVTSY